MDTYYVEIPTGETLEIIWLPREGGGGWGGGPVKAGYPVDPTQFLGWVLHHTVMVMQDYDRDGFLHGDLDDIKRYMRVLQGIRPDLGGEVPYSVVPFPGAHPLQVVLAEGRGWGRTGAHTIGYNSSRYAWALPGNYMDDVVTAAQVWGMRWIAHRWTPWSVSDAFGHQEVYATACPGTSGMAVLPLLQPPYRELPQPSEEDEMTEDQMRELKKYIDSTVEKHVSFWAQRGFDHTNGVGDNVISVVEDADTGNRKHARTMAESVKAEISKVCGPQKTSSEGE